MEGGEAAAAAASEGGGGGRYRRGHHFRVVRIQQVLRGLRLLGHILG